MPDPKHKKRETLKIRYAADILPLTADGITDPINLKEGLKTLHTTSVRETIANQNQNKVLQEPAPAVNTNEKSLPRRTRTILAQLRSGYSTHLESYLHRINRTGHPSDICPQCGQEPQTTAHLFNCSANPTTLTTRTLWEDPPAAAAFLDLPTHQDDELDDND